MEMVAAGQTRGAGAAQDGAFFQFIPHLHINLAHVAVTGKDPQAVVQDHGLAINSQGLSVDYRFVLVHVGAPVPEAGHGLAEKAPERPGPQGLGVALG